MIQGTINNKTIYSNNLESYEEVRLGKIFEGEKEGNGEVEGEEEGNGEGEGEEEKVIGVNQHTKTKGMT